LHKGIDMANSRISEVLLHLREGRLRAELTDGQLLEDYIRHRHETALEALVRRHGPMVWGVCRRVLRNYHDAEDAFQAAFLVLVRKATSIVPRAMVGNWLYGVAFQTALKARITAAKRGSRERQVTEVPEPAVMERDLWHDLQPLLDRELSLLPDKYRVAIVMCDLEGKTRRQAARQLGVPDGTLAARLARGRVMLAKRLARHGLAVSGGSLAVVFAQSAASAGVPDSVVSSTIRAASFFAAGQAAATGPVSVKAAALTEGVLRAMLMSKLKAVVAVLLVLGFIVTGATVLSGRTTSAPDGQPATERPAATPEKQKQGPEKEDFTAWGQEFGGLQAGLGYASGQKRVYDLGETVKLVVRVRNVGKKEVQFQYVRHFFIENPPRRGGRNGQAAPPQRRHSQRDLQAAGR
jgi:RNA polymerase sigma factor (sigma-70 family)